MVREERGKKRRLRRSITWTGCAARFRACRLDADRTVRDRGLNRDRMVSNGDNRDNNKGSRDSVVSQVSNRGRLGSAARDKARNRVAGSSSQEACKVVLADGSSETEAVISKTGEAAT